MKRASIKKLKIQTSKRTVGGGDQPHIETRSILKQNKKNESIKLFYVNAVVVEHAVVIEHAVEIEHLIFF